MHGVVRHRERGRWITFTAAAERNRVAAHVNQIKDAGAEEQLQLSS